MQLMGASYKLPCNFVKSKIYTLKAVKPFLSIWLFHSNKTYFSSQDVGLVATLVPLNWNLSGDSSPDELLHTVGWWCVIAHNLFICEVDGIQGGLSGCPERRPHVSVSVVLMSTLLHLQKVPSTSNKYHLAALCCRLTSLLQLLAQHSAGCFILKSWALDNPGRVLVFIPLHPN